MNIQNKTYARNAATMEKKKTIWENFQRNGGKKVNKTFAKINSGNGKQTKTDTGNPNICIERGVDIVEYAMDARESNWRLANNNSISWYQFWSLWSDLLAEYWKLF